jgi:hypothetical protein
MSFFKNGLGRGIARKAKAALGQGESEARPSTRSDEAQPSSRPTAPRSQEDGQRSQEAGQKEERPRQKLKKLERENASLRAQLLKTTGVQEGGIQPENVIWILGSGRTGSSWLAFMMGALPDTARWNEPLIGYLFAQTYYERGEHRTEDKFYVLADAYKETWLGSIRHLVLNGASARFPELTENSYLVLKEPHGAKGAPFLMEALPESRMIFLIRDPRDVVVSTLKATWNTRQGTTRPRPKRRELALERPNDFVRKRAETYLQDIQHVQQAYDAHEGRKVVIRYEDLRADALGTMRRICSELEIPASEEDLVRSVEEYAWESIPEEEKGEGKGRRKATPGGWKEDLTPEQIEIIEKEAAPILDQFYNEDRQASSSH